jgi:hypothetical protein
MKNEDVRLPEQEQKDLFELFGKHLIALTATLTCLKDRPDFKKGFKEFVAYSATVVSYRGGWWLVSAGHIFKDLQKALDDNMVGISNPVIMDYLAAEAANKLPIPFPFMKEDWGFIDNEYDGLDFAVMPLSPVYRACLEKNKIAPFQPSHWVPRPDIRYEGYALLGFPAEKVKGVPAANSPSLTGFIQPSLLALQSLPDEGVTSFPRFKARIKGLGPLTSVKGMSGGPILGFYTEGPDMKYRIVAIQSRWDKKDIVYGCPVPIFMDLVEKYIDSRTSHSPATGS